jgi:hypothetical protein
MTESTDLRCDVTIVGGGPAGCATGVFTARSGLETYILDRGPSSIHHCAYLENYLGFPAGIDIETFCALAQDHAREMGCSIVRDGAVAIQRDDDGFLVETDDDRSIRTDRVVAATKYDPDYLRSLGQEEAMFELYERDGETRDRFDNMYPDDDGTTPIEGLYVAGALADVPDQVLISAGHGAIVGRQIRTDSRLEQGYWDHVADRVDWVRRDRPDNEWREQERWREWFHDRLPPELDPEDDWVSEIVDRVAEESIETYLSPEEIEDRTRRGHRAIADQLDDEVLLAALDDETLREYVEANNGE